ncbi:MAG: DUF2795 domain-containing protein [Rhodospirillales bacterium]|nr:DUF2795 domain-containing protein [Rhodospirillales bacterium]
MPRRFKGVDFPVSQTDLVEHAKENGADQGVFEVLSKMPRRPYRSMADLMETYGETSA